MKGLNPLVIVNVKVISLKRIPASIVLIDFLMDTVTEKQPMKVFIKIAKLKKGVLGQEKSSIVIEQYLLRNPLSVQL